MLLGIKSRRMVLLRYVVVGVFAGISFYMGWWLNSTWSADMRLWKSFGVATFALLYFTAVIGPAAVVWSPLMSVVTWRRETGVWFVVMGLVHGYLVWDGWARWDVARLLGFRYAPELDIYLRAEPGFGLANLMGILALGLGLSLAATSFDKAVGFLGISSWKWLHTFTYVIFYVAVLHAIYFAFIHYTPSPERPGTVYPANPLRFVYVGALLSVALAQAAAFFKILSRRRAVGAR